MHDSRAVRGRERIGHLDRHLQGMFERQRPALQPILERLALEILHHEEVNRLP